MKTLDMDCDFSKIAAQLSLIHIYTEAKRGTSWKQKLKQTIDRLVITAKDYDDFLRLMQERCV